MNLKVANLVAIQLGIFIGIMSWLTYSRFESPAPRIVAKTQERAAQTVAPARSVVTGEEQRPSAADDWGDRDDAPSISEQPAPAMHQYSEAAVQRYSDMAAQLYYQQIAPRRYASSGLESGPIIAKAPSSTEVEQAPAVVQDYPAPETVAYVEPAQVVVYPQPQFVVFSNSRRFANRCRPPFPVRGPHIARTHRRPDRPRPHVSGLTDSVSPASPSAALRRRTQSLGVVQRRNDKMASCRPAEGFGPRGRR